MATAGIISGHDLNIHMHHENRISWCCISHFASLLKMGVIDVDVHISSHLKAELVWAADK